MKKLLLVIGFGLLVTGAAFAGGGFEDMPQQQVAPQETPRDNTGAYLVAAAALTAAGTIAAATVASRRKKN